MELVSNIYTFWKEEAERDLQVLGVRRWRESMADRKKLKDNVQQPTVGCSANRRRRRRNIYTFHKKFAKMTIGHGISHKNTKYTKYAGHT